MIGYRYIKGECIGSGGFGKIYKVRGILGMSPCCRVPWAYQSPMVAKEIANIERHSIDRELDAMHALSNADGVSQLLDVVYDYDRTSLVMPDYGSDLFSYIISDKYNMHDNSFTFSILLKLTRIVYSCHLNGVIHLDIKPENIMVDNDMNLTLIDFGAACVYGTFEATTIQTPITHVCGTARYSPEEILSYPASASGKTDVWSIAATAATCFDPHYHYEVMRNRHSIKPDPFIADILFRSSAQIDERLCITELITTLEKKLHEYKLSRVSK